MPKEYFANKGKSRSGGGPFAMGSYGQGKNPIMMKSPLEKGETRTIDKIKAAGKAAIAGLYADSSDRSSNVISTISRAYKKEKEKYRDIQSKKEK